MPAPQPKKLVSLTWETAGWRRLLRFLLPSLLGVFLFLTPVYVSDKWNIPVGVMAETVQSWSAAWLPGIMTTVMVVAALGSILFRVFQPHWIARSAIMRPLFDLSWGWLTFRVVGAIFAAMTLWEWGPEAITSEVTGGTVLFALIPVLATWFLFASLFMPLLMEFGLMDFIGTVVHKVMRPLFRLPGRSSIDAVASWMGSGPVGVLITTKQYEKGYYTQREAAVIATNFSIASIAFSLVIATYIGVGAYFLPLYGTILLAGVVAAFICPRIPPLSWKPDIYYEPVGKQIDEEVPAGKSPLTWGMEQAKDQASRASIRGVLKASLANVLDIWLGLIPLVMGLGTLALIVAEFTPLFQWLSIPLIPLLTLLQVPEAEAAAPALIVGFVDMFLPAVIGAGIESELTRFVIAGMAVSQLIYLSEIGILLLKSKIPIRFWELAVIFLQRTLITLPLFVWVGHVLF
ncbi:YjiH family protein [Desmospora activa]|uniref:Nucleoside recognition membrane protein YjiH n=1 Tax=Desmospora activa DSM 45169 TaxID=1121389 RepID=A0A2T4ZDQ2_9BACL|nr:YjiH family protein [Desmospora activa]PTM60019.1 nucleoside recognition membrane protein YjiH [Desmospora activa DSM 45169]